MPHTTDPALETPPRLSTPSERPSSHEPDWLAWLAIAGLLLVCLLIAFLRSTYRLQAATGVLGIVVLLAIAVAMSSDRRHIRVRTVAWGFGLQILLAAIFLKISWTRLAFDKAAAVIQTVLNYAFDGSKFVFGVLGAPGSGNSSLGVIFAFQVLPVIIFVASLMAVLYYIGLMPRIVKGFAYVMTRLMRVSGAESLNVAASIFVGQTEAPLTIRPFLDGLTESELFTVMVSGMAHVSGSIMGGYVLVAHVSMAHLMAAVLITAPATLMLAKIIVPERQQPATARHLDVEPASGDVNVIDAATRGAGEGLFLALNVAAMLIAFIALIALADGILSHLHTTVEAVLGKIMAPIAWLLGVPARDAGKVGSLLGTRMVLNEFVAYVQLGAMQARLAARSFAIATFALCGFANLASIGIQIGGIGSLAPSRKHDLARLGLRAMIAGTLANFMSAAIAGLFL